MRVSLYLSFCVVTVTLFLMVVLTCGKPQGVGIRVNNNALFTLGAGLLLTGLAFHAGQESTRHQQQQQYYPQNQYYRPYNGGYVGPYRSTTYYHYFRRRRQVNPQEEEKEIIVDPRIEQLFQMAQDKDTSGCILQMTCYIGTIPSSSLVGHAKTLHSILLSTTSKKNNLKNEEMGNPMEPFLLALQHGEDGEDCDNLFSNCTLTSNQLIQQFQEMKAATSVKL